jgi:hypothetical protein
VGRITTRREIAATIIMLNLLDRFIRHTSGVGSRS